MNYLSYYVNWSYEYIFQRQIMNVFYIKYKQVFQG